tara:strand:- start:73 stop:189 length:117 start_codon:yes stop_codon:yes gene_type:complete
MKKILIILAFVFAINSCSTVSEINERVKGDGVPYIPGI